MRTQQYSGNLIEDLMEVSKAISEIAANRRALEILIHAYTHLAYTLTNDDGSAAWDIDGRIDAFFYLSAFADLLEKKGRTQ